MKGARRSCDFCKLPAIYNSQTKIGPKAFLCENHFNQLGLKEPGTYELIQPKEVLVKKCEHCGEVKPLTEFYKYTDSHGFERHRNECRECNLLERKAANYRRAKRQDNGR